MKSIRYSIFLFLVVIVAGTSCKSSKHKCDAYSYHQHPVEPEAAEPADK